MIRLRSLPLSSFIPSRTFSLSKTSNLHARAFSTTPIVGDVADKVINSAPTDTKSNTSEVNKTRGEVGGWRGGRKKGGAGDAVKVRAELEAWEVAQEEGRKMDVHDMLEYYKLSRSHFNIPELFKFISLLPHPLPPTTQRTSELLRCFAIDIRPKLEKETHRWKAEGRYDETLGNETIINGTYKLSKMGYHSSVRRFLNEISPYLLNNKDSHSITAKSCPPDTILQLMETFQPDVIRKGMGPGKSGYVKRYGTPASFKSLDEPEFAMKATRKIWSREKGEDRDADRVSRVVRALSAMSEARKPWEKNGLFDCLVEGRDNVGVRPEEDRFKVEVMLDNMTERGGVKEFEMISRCLVNIRHGQPRQSTFFQSFAHKYEKYFAENATPMEFSSVLMLYVTVKEKAKNKKRVQLPKDVEARLRGDVESLFQGGEKEFNTQMETAFSMDYFDLPPLPSHLTTHLFSIPPPSPVTQTIHKLISEASEFDDLIAIYKTNGRDFTQEEWGLFMKNLAAKPIRSGSSFLPRKDKRSDTIAKVASYHLDQVVKANGLRKFNIGEIRDIVAWLKHNGKKHAPNILEQIKENAVDIVMAAEKVGEFAAISNIVDWTTAIFCDNDTMLFELAKRPTWVFSDDRVTGFERGKRRDLFKLAGIIISSLVKDENDDGDDTINPNGEVLEEFIKHMVGIEEPTLATDARFKMVFGRELQTTLFCTQAILRGMKETGVVNEKFLLDLSERITIGQDEVKQVAQGRRNMMKMQKVFKELESQCCEETRMKLAKNMWWKKEIIPPGLPTPPKPLPVKNINIIPLQA